MNEAVRKAMLNAMKKSGLTQEALAQRVGVSQPVIWQYLSGKRAKVPTVLQDMLEALDLELIVCPKTTPPAPKIEKKES